MGEREGEPRSEGERNSIPLAASLGVLRAPRGVAMPKEAHLAQVPFSRLAAIATEAATSAGRRPLLTVRLAAQLSQEWQ